MKKCEQEAHERVENVKGFYTHLIVFIIINLVFLIINLAFIPSSIWFYWITIFWGIALAIHAINVYVLCGRLFDKTWEEKKMKKYLVEEIEEEKEREQDEK